MAYLVDGHMHLEYGPLSEEYVLEFIAEAKRKGLSEIQILDHTHRFIEFEPMYESLKKYPIQKEWLENKEKKFKDHVSDFIELMEKIKQKDLGIKVTYGLEVCYTPKTKEFIKETLANYKLDFVVGAIHSVNDILYDMDFSKELLWEKYDVNKIYKDYYQALLDLVNSKLFTQVAHPDTIKIFNYYPNYDLSETYKTLALAIKKNNMKAEDNVGCHYRYGCKDLGLSDELLKVFIDNDVDIITCSDAHHPTDVGTDIKEVTNKINTFKEGKNYVR